jgi:primosomal protein N' (replication factor Y)
LLSRPDLRAGEETLRRWLNATALVRPGARVIVVADGALRPVQALIRSDPAGFSDAELAERIALSFPPAVRLATVTGRPAALRDFQAEADLPASATVLGPVPADAEDERLLIRVPRTDGGALVAALKTAMAARTARKAADPVRVQVDPHALG